MRHQLEHVEPDEQRQQHQHRDQGDRPVDDFGNASSPTPYMIFSEASNSVLSIVAVAKPAARADREDHRQPHRDGEIEVELRADVHVIGGFCRPGSLVSIAPANTAGRT